MKRLSNKRLELERRMDRGMKPLIYAPLSSGAIR